MDTVSFHNQMRQMQKQIAHMVVKISNQQTQGLPSCKLSPLVQPLQRVAPVTRPLYPITRNLFLVCLQLWVILAHTSSMETHTAELA
jgi:hypothetical protein